MNERATVSSSRSIMARVVTIKSLIDKVALVESVQSELALQVAALEAQLDAITRKMKDVVIKDSVILDGDILSRLPMTRLQALDAGHDLQVGRRGGVFYMSKSGNKVYVKK